MSVRYSASCSTSSRTASLRRVANSFNACAMYSAITDSSTSSRKSVNTTFLRDISGCSDGRTYDADAHAYAAYWYSRFSSAPSKMTYSTFLFPCSSVWSVIITSNVVNGTRAGTHASANGADDNGTGNGSSRCGLYGELMRACTCRSMALASLGTSTTRMLGAGALRCVSVHVQK